MNRTKLLSIISISFIAGVLLIAPLPSSADTMIYACVTNDQGRTRIVNGAGQCRPTETEISWSADADLSQIESNIADLQQQVSELGFIPQLLAFPQSTIRPRGPPGTGCGEFFVFSQIGRLSLIADCVADNQIPFGYHLYAQHAPDPAYIYDGVYVCLTIGQAAIDRDDGFGDRLSVSVTPLSTSIDPNTGAISSRTTTGSTPLILTMNLGSFDESDVPPLEFGNVDAPCKRFAFADGVNVSSGITFDEWTPPGQILVDVRLPNLAGGLGAVRNDGDIINVYEVGLTVSGRNPAAQ